MFKLINKKMQSKNYYQWYLFKKYKINLLGLFIKYDQLLNLENIKSHFLKLI